MSVSNIQKAPRFCGRVRVELDHAHHPLLAHLSLWPDLPWKVRQGMQMQPLIDALRLGPLAADGLVARVRTNDWAGIDVLWVGPTPDQMRALVRTATQLGLKCRLALLAADERRDANDPLHSRFRYSLVNGSARVAQDAVNP